MKHSVRIVIAAIGVISLGGAAAEGVGTHKGKPTLVPDEVIVKYDASVTKGQKARVRHAGEGVEQARKWHDG